MRILRELRELLDYHSKFTARFAFHDYRNVFKKTFRNLRELGFQDIRDQRVLDLGCGQRYPFALLCAASGAEVTALDIDYVRPDPLPVALLRMARTNGLKRALKTTLRRTLYDGKYYKLLEEAAGQSLRSFQQAIEFVVADPEAARYPVPSCWFDLVVSNAVVEHVVDVREFAAEVNRILAKGGWFYATIHNYYSLSGGHNLEWAYPDDDPSSRVPPWDHLRENRFPAWVHLNRLRPIEYRDAFSEHLDVLRFEGQDINHDPGGLEGEQFLTPEVAMELTEYPRELLLTRSWCIVCQKT